MEVLDEPLERHVLMGEGGDRGRPGAGEQLTAGRVAGQIEPQDERVQEAADEVLELGALAPGDGHSDDDVRLTGMAAQDDRPRGQGGHERRHALGLAAGPQPGSEPSGDDEVEVAPLVAEHRRAGAIERQVKLLEVLELPAPVLQVGVEGSLVLGPTLPDREVGVLDGQLREGDRSLGDEARVEGRDLAPEHLHRPAVGDDVVYGQQEDVGVGAQPDERRAQERPDPEVERRGRELGRHRRHGRQLVPSGRAREVDEGQRDVPVRRDALHGLAVHGHERGAQDLVTGHDSVDAPLERSPPHRSRNLDGGGLDVERTAGRELVEKPQPSLRERQWRRVPVSPV